MGIYSQLRNDVIDAGRKLFTNLGGESLNVVNRAPVLIPGEPNADLVRRLVKNGGEPTCHAVDFGRATNDSGVSEEAGIIVALRFAN